MFEVVLLWCKICIDMLNFRIIKIETFHNVYLLNSYSESYLKSSLYHFLKKGLYQCVLELFISIVNVLQVACITHSEISDRKIKEIEKIHKKYKRREIKRKRGRRN